MVKQQHEEPRSLRLEWIEAGSLADNPKNWRRHPAPQRRALSDLLDDPQVGWAGALLYNERTGHLIDGHLRKASVGPKTAVPVLVGSWSEEGERRILATLDPLAAMATADPMALEALLAETAFDTEALCRMADALLISVQEAQPAKPAGEEAAPKDAIGRFDIVVECPDRENQLKTVRRLVVMGLHIRTMDGWRSTKDGASLDKTRET